MKSKVLYFPVALVIALCLLLTLVAVPSPSTVAAQGTDLVAWGVTQVNFGQPDEYSQIFKLNLDTGYIQIIRDNPADPLYSSIGVAPSDKWLYAAGRSSHDKTVQAPDGTTFPNYRDWYRLNPTTAVVQNTVLNALDKRANAMYSNEGGAFGFNFQVVLFVDGPGVSPEYGDSRPHLRTRGYKTGGDPDSPSSLSTRDEGEIVVTDPPAGMTYTSTGGLQGISDGIAAENSLHTTFEIEGGKTAIVEMPTTATGVSQNQARYVSTVDFVVNALVYGDDWKQEAYAVSGFQVYKLNAQTGSTTPYLDLEPFLKGPIIAMTPALETSLSGVSVATSALPDGQPDTSYEATLEASGGTEPYTWDIAEGSLPDGLTLAPTGTIAGTPTAPGEFNFMVEVTDDTDAIAMRRLSITVSAPTPATPTPAATTPTPTPAATTPTPTPAPPTPTTPAGGITVGPATLPTGKVGEYYAAALTASGGTEPYTWKITSGVLPTALNLSDAGVIWGTPTSTGTFNVTIRATDSLGSTGSGSFSITITRLAIDTSTLPTGQLGQSYEATLQASGGTEPYTWVITQGTLPAGLTLSTNGVISGIPTVSQTSYFTVRVTDGQGKTAIRELSIYIPFYWNDSFEDESRISAKNNVIISDGSVKIDLVKTEKYNFTDSTNNNAYEGTSFDTTTEVSAAAYQNMAKADGVEYAYGGTTEFRYQVFQIKVYPNPTQIDTGTIKWVGSASHGYTLFLLNPQTSVWEQWASSGTSETGIVTNENQVTNFGDYIDGSGYVKIAARTSQEGRRGFLGIGTRNVTIRTDYVELVVQLVPPPSGSVTSVPVQRPALYTWGKFTASHEIPAGASIVYTVLNASNDSPLLTILAAEAVAGYDLSTLPADVTSIKLQAVLTPGSTPVLSEWVVQAFDTLPVIATKTLPAGQVTKPYNATLNAAGGVSPYTWEITGGTVPAGLILSSTGVISGMPTTGGTFYFTVRATDADGRRASSEFSITIVDLQIITTDLPGGQVGVPYKGTLESSGGTPPYVWERTGGLLPGGVTFSSAGIVSGIPTTKGDFVLFVKLTDGGGFTVDKGFFIKIKELVFEPPQTLPDGQVGVNWEKIFKASGGTPPYTWEISQGTLPAGLKLNSETGKISGTPTAAGVFDFTIQVTDDAPVSLSADLSITVTQLAIDTITLPDGKGGLDYEATLEASGGTEPYTWKISEGAYPTGLELDPNTGNISGTLPDTPKVFQFTVQVTDGADITASRNLAIEVTVLTIDVVLPNSVPKDEEYRATLTAADATEPLTWEIVDGELPEGLTLDPDTGVISGNATRGGEFEFTVKVTDATGREVVKEFSIEVVTEPSAIGEIIETAWWLIIVVVFVIILIALAIYFFLRRRRRKKMEQSKESQANQETEKSEEEQTT